MFFPLMYGPAEIKARLNPGQVAWSIEPNHVSGKPETVLAVKEALSNPIGKFDEPFRKAGVKRAVLLVDDLTRSTPQREIIPEVLNYLNDRGTPDSAISALIAVGTHRKMNVDEIRHRFGDEATRRIPFKNHEFDNPAMLVDLGRTPGGTPVVVNRIYHEADLKIAIGAVVPHMYAGWSGGAKMVQPGISGGETTAGTHLAAGRLGFDAILGKAVNPVRNEIQEVGRISGLSLIFNVVQNQAGELVGAFFGDPVAAYRKAVECAKTVYEVKVSSQVDCVVCGCFPCDQDIWQTQKPLLTACMLCREGGTVLLLSRCPDLVNDQHPLFCQAAGKTLVDVERSISNAGLREAIDAGALMGLLPFLRTRKIHFVSEPSAQREIEGFGCHYEGNDPVTAIESLVTSLPKETIYGVIKSHAGDIIPIFD